jgi:hypothetical protein
LRVDEAIALDIAPTSTEEVIHLVAQHVNMMSAISLLGRESGVHDLPEQTLVLVHVVNECVPAFELAEAWPRNALEHLQSLLLVKAHHFANHPALQRQPV